MRPPLVLLCLHRVLPARRRGGADEPYFLRHTALELGRFSRLLDALAVRCDVLDLAQPVLLWSVAAAARTRPVVALTFDDGYADVEEFALPELARRGLRAAMCVTSGAASGALALPVDGWYAALAGATAHRGVLEGFGVAAWRFDLSAPMDRQRLIDGPEKRAYVRAGEEERAQLLERLRQVLGSEVRPRPALLGPEGIRRLWRAGWTIGAHGHSHALLGALPVAQAAQELAVSRDWLVEQGLPPPELVAYPDGDVSPEVEALAAAAGYQLGLALGGRAVAESDGLLRLPRLIVKNEDDWAERRLWPLLVGA